MIGPELWIGHLVVSHPKVDISHPLQQLLPDVVFLREGILCNYVFLIVEALLVRGRIVRSRYEQLPHAKLPHVRPQIIHPGGIQFHAVLRQNGAVGVDEIRIVPVATGRDVCLIQPLAVVDNI